MQERAHYKMDGELNDSKWTHNTSAVAAAQNQILKMDFFIFFFNTFISVLMPISMFGFHFFFLTLWLQDRACKVVFRYVITEKLVSIVCWTAIKTTSLGPHILVCSPKRKRRMCCREAVIRGQKQLWLFPICCVI